MGNLPLRSVHLPRPMTVELHAFRRQRATLHMETDLGQRKLGYFLFQFFVIFMWWGGRYLNYPHGIMLLLVHSLIHAQIDEPALSRFGDDVYAQTQYELPLAHRPRNIVTVSRILESKIP